MEKLALIFSKTFIVSTVLREFCGLWGGREHVETNAINSWKLDVFGIVGGGVSFCCSSLDLLPSGHSYTFGHLKKGIREFHGRFVLAPADKAANNVVVV